MKLAIAALSMTCALGLTAVNFESAEALSSKKSTVSELINLDLPTRPDADKARDAGRKPAEVISFLGVTTGMTVMDLMASGGYYTEVLSIAVGETGTVYAENPPMFLAWNDGVYEKALSKRLEGGRLPNVTRIDQSPDQSGLAEGTIDAAISALNFHDIYNGSPEVGIGFIKAMYPLMKPGGVIGIIDHHGDAGQDNTSLHRIELKDAIAAAEAAGYVVEATSDILLTGVDDRTKSVFDPSVRGKTDRFILRLKKPE